MRTPSRASSHSRYARDSSESLRFHSPCVTGIGMCLTAAMYPLRCFAMSPLHSGMLIDCCAPVHMHGLCLLFCLCGHGQSCAARRSFDKHDEQLHKTLSALWQAVASYFKWAASASVPAPSDTAITAGCLAAFLAFTDACAAYYRSGLPASLIAHVRAVVRSQKDKASMSQALATQQWRCRHLAAADGIWLAAGNSLQVMLSSGASAGDGTGEADEQHGRGAAGSGRKRMRRAVT